MLRGARRFMTHASDRESATLPPQLDFVQRRVAVCGTFSE
jgi:hypothetical protein